MLRIRKQDQISAGISRAVAELEHRPFLCAVIVTRSFSNAVLRAHLADRPAICRDVALVIYHSYVPAPWRQCDHSRLCLATTYDHCRDKSDGGVETRAHVCCRLTVKLRGRAEAPAIGAQGANFLAPEAPNKKSLTAPFQRLLDGTLKNPHAFLLKACIKTYQRP